MCSTLAGGKFICPEKTTERRIIHGVTKGNSLRNSLLEDDCHGLPAYVVHISDPSIFSFTEAPAWEY